MLAVRTMLAACPPLTEKVSAISAYETPPTKWRSNISQWGSKPSVTQRSRADDAALRTMAAAHTLSNSSTALVASATGSTDVSAESVSIRSDLRRRASSWRKKRNPLISQRRRGSPLSIHFSKYAGCARRDAKNPETRSFEVPSDRKLEPAT